jgi:predicted peptidase
MFRAAVLAFSLLMVLSGAAVLAQAQDASAPQLLRKRYFSETTGKVRDYYVFLPKGYHSQPEKRWPTMLFLHGSGERGNGLSDLEKVLVHGPLMEAWIQGRDLQMILIVPQAAFPDDRDNNQKVREGFTEKREAGAMPPARLHETFQAAPIPEDWGPLRDRTDGTVINAWLRMEKELEFMLRTTATDYRVDRRRIYLSGLSMGGFGSFAIGAKYPNLFAAIAPICGGGDPNTVDELAASQRPMWVFHGGRDRVVSPSESLRMVNALIEKGHRNIRFTVHEELGHNVWTRVYESEDFYRWLLEQQLPEPENPRRRR